MFDVKENKLIYHYDAEEVWIEAWGKNAVRVRVTKNAKMPDNDWALTVPQSEAGEIKVSEKSASLANGKLNLNITSGGKITIRNSEGKLLMEEYWRNRRDFSDPKLSSIEV